MCLCFGQAQTSFHNLLFIRTESPVKVENQSPENSLLFSGCIGLCFNRPQCTVLATKKEYTGYIATQLKQLF